MCHPSPSKYRSVTISHSCTCLLYIQHFLLPSWPSHWLLMTLADSWPPSAPSTHSSLSLLYHLSITLLLLPAPQQSDLVMTAEMFGATKWKYDFLTFPRLLLSPPSSLPPLPLQWPTYNTWHNELCKDCHGSVDNVAQIKAQPSMWRQHWKVFRQSHSASEVA